MRAGKAYITSLGTTGLLVTCSLLLLVAVGAVIAFDAWPSSQEPGAPETVSITARDKAVTAKHEHGIAAQRRARAAGARHARQAARGKRRATPASGTGGDRVVSDLPAPGTRHGSGSGGGSGGDGGSAAAGTPAAGGGGPSHQVGDAVSNVSPQAGGLVANTGGALGDDVGVVVDTAPVLPAPALP